MRKILFLFLLTLSLYVFAAPGAQANSGSIAATVNEDAISMSDVEDRATLVIRTSGMPDNEEVRTSLRPRILDALVEEQLKMQEAKRLEVVVEQAEIDEGFTQLAQQNNASAEQFRAMISGAGINLNTMYRQIRSQIAWGKVIQQTVRPRITVTDADVEDAMARLRENLGKNEYRVAEIFLPLESSANASDTHKLAFKLASDMQAGKVPFFRVAQQFSKSAGAAQGGDLGWIQQGQLSADLENTIAAMAVEQVSQPIKTQAGYHILMLREKRTMSEDTMPSKEGVIATIGTQRMERMQRRQLMDLKAAAFIETRV